MSLMYIPRERSPWEQMLPGFVQNLMFNQMATSREDKQIKAKTAAAQAEELRGYQAAGWRQPEAQKPVIEIGGTGLVPPETGFEVKTQNGRQVLVQTRTPYGGEPQVQKASVIKTDKGHKPGTVDVFDSKSGRTYIYPTYVSGGKLLRGNEPIGEKRPSGLKFTQTPEGGIELVMGGGGGVGSMTPLTKPNVTKVQQEVMSSEDRLVRIKDIMDTYQAGYTDKWERLGKSWDEFKENWRIGTPSTATERKELGEYSVWRQNSLKDINKEIHDFAGGNMTKHELKQKLGELPDPGKKWYQGDSHTVFTNKLANTFKGLAVISARKKYLLKQGNTQKDIDGMLSNDQIITVANFERKADEAAVAKRAQLVQQAKTSGADITDITVQRRITAAVLGFLNQEFGFAFNVGQ